MMSIGDDDDDGATTIKRFKKATKPAPKPAFEIGRQILESMALKHDPSGAFYEYIATAGYWCRRNDHYMFHLVHKVVPSRPASSKVEIIKWLAGETHDADLEFGRVGPAEVAAQNWIVDAKSRRRRKHAPEHMLDSVIPHDYDGAAECPRFLAALETWCGGDDQRFYAVQQFMGYIVLPHAHYKKALMIYGPHDTGKSSLLKIMRALAGAQWCCSLPVGAFDDPVRMWSIMHKRLNVVTEATSDEIIKGPGFKTLISTEEPVEINPKFKDPMQYVPNAKHVIACNELPRIFDQSGATVRRLLLVPFDNQVAEDQQDDGLVDAIVADEMSGVLNFAIQGAAELVGNGGRFCVVDAARQQVLDIIDDANPIIGFLDAEMVKSDDPLDPDMTPLIDIARRFNEQNYGLRMDARKAGKHLRAHLGKDSVRQHRQADGRNGKALVGWRLRIAQVRG